MSSSKNKCLSCGGAGKRACPALKGSICPECCGKKRGSSLKCPAECEFFPFGIHTYDQWLKLDGSWMPKTLDFILSKIGKDHFLENLDLNSHGEEEGEEALATFLGDTVNYSLCIERNEEGKTLVEMWEEEGFPGLANDERVMTQYRGHTFATVLEVQKIINQQSILCLDIFEPDSKPFTVFDRGMAKNSIPFGRYLSWVAHFPHYSRVTGSGLEVTHMIWSQFKEELVGSATEVGLTLKQLLSQHFGEYCDAIRDMARAAVKNIATSIDLHQCAATYRIQGDRSEVEAILNKKPEFELHDQAHDEADPPGTVRYVWLRRGESQKIEAQMLESFRYEEGDMAVGVLGNVRLRSDSLVVETFSKQQFKFAKKMVKKYFGKLLALEKEGIVDIAKIALESSREKKEERLPLKKTIEPEVETEIVRAAMMEHYRKLLDMKVPAINNLTPRQASKDPQMRPALTDWIKGHLNSLHRMQAEKSAFIDLGWFLDELGLQELK